MPRYPVRPKDITPFGEIIWSAMERKSTESGAPYGYAQLARDVSARMDKPISHAHVRNIVTGYRPRPRREMVEAIIAALGLEPAAALIAAGYTPPDMQRLAAAEHARNDRVALAERLLAEMDDFAADTDTLRERLRRFITRDSVADKEKKPNGGSEHPAPA